LPGEPGVDPACGGVGEQAGSAQARLPSRRPATSSGSETTS
jgi:hypothetical protein